MTAGFSIPAVLAVSVLLSAVVLSDRLTLGPMGGDPAPSARAGSAEPPAEVDLGWLAPPAAAGPHLANPFAAPSADTPADTPEDTPMEGPAAPEPELHLHGVFRAGTRTTALIRRGPDGPPRWVGPGDRIGSRRVISIGADRAELEDATGRQVLTLRAPIPTARATFAETPSAPAPSAETSPAPDRGDRP